MENNTERNNRRTKIGVVVSDKMDKKCVLKRKINIFSLIRR